MKRGFAWGLFLAALVLTRPAMAQTLGGLQIGGTADVGKTPDTTEQAGPHTVRDWVLDYGNILSATTVTATGKIVATETDWGGRIEGEKTDFPGLLFGKSSLADIRRMAGGQGFAFDATARPKRGPDNAMVFMSSYEVAGSGGGVVTFVTKADQGALAGLAKDADFAPLAKLDAILVGDPAYLTKSWGARTPDPEGRPITWPKP